ncbi:unnamed protein product [Mycena citricolor]|uniref:Xylanolytic transcriptional activator regulatory domain-containing protein n=1 Tax=Mycena citricolor TaxID=2018698 RepID=A0AAD2H989_9AGAR|nr:unnamed protein product [Mycena citricolor]
MLLDVSDLQWPSTRTIHASLPMVTRLPLRAGSSLLRHSPYARHLSLQSIMSNSMLQVSWLFAVSFVSLAAQLMTLYLIGTALPQACWFYLGLGIRFLQQRGQHRTKRQPGSPDPESELWNRAFWAFICLDRTVCAFIGRPLAFHIEDYEVDPPLEVDDEYWEQGFVQPPGVPSAYSFFVYYLQYSEILADAIRRLYATRRTKARMGWLGKEWEQQILAELDSALEALSTSLPIHLRWNPENMPQDPLIMDQAATLHIVENYVTILIHRPFIQRNNELATRSHSVCIRAARSILHTAGAWFNRLHRLPTVHALNPCFVSNLILLMSGNVAERDLALIEIGMQIIKFSETRWQAAGRFWDMLTELRSLDRQPRAQPNKMQQRNIAPPRAPTGFATQQTSQHSELFNAVAPDPLWYAKMARSAQPPSPLFKPGMSIEQLLANTGPFQPLDFTLDDQMMDLDDQSMSTWMSTPMHLSDLRQWDAYIGSMNVGGGNRPQWAH